MTKEQMIWLAGFIDGEGYIGVVRKSTRYQAQVRICTTHRQTMLYVAALLGCPLGIHKSSKPKKQWKPAFRAVVYDKRAEELCRTLLPYFITKKEQARNLLAYRKTIQYGRNQFSEPAPERKHFWLRGKELNKRGA